MVLTVFRQPVVTRAAPATRATKPPKREAGAHPKQVPFDWIGPSRVDAPSAPPSRPRPPPTRTTMPLETLMLEAELRDKKRVAVRFPFGDWIEFRDNGQPCVAAMIDYVISPESVALVREGRAKEEAARKRDQKARRQQTATGASAGPISSSASKEVSG
jgi:hypothetical protein